MSEQIIVGYNGAEASAEAVEWAANEAVARGVPLSIVCCFDVSTIAGDAAFGYGAGAAFDAARTSADANAERIRSSVAASHPSLEFTCEVVVGAADRVMIEGATQDDLIVVGSSGHDGLASFWLGSTPRSLVHHSPCPVVIVRGAATQGRPDRIVVGVDGSDASDRAVRWAADEADRHHANLVIVHGWSYPYAPTDIGSQQARDMTRIDAACTLDQAAEQARERCGVEVTTLLVEHSAVTALLDTVRDGDLLVVGSRGRGAVRSRLFGSTANSVLDASSVPVVVVRATAEDGHASPATDTSVAGLVTTR